MAKLLLLDDDDETLAWMSAALQSLGHEVRSYVSSRAALGALDAWSPDLIVADILMPEMDGLTFARMVRRRHTPVMFVSIARKQAEAVLCGAVGYIQKPATAGQIRQAVGRVLGRGDSRNSILVVDDEDELREYYRLLLQPQSTVLLAENGETALRQLHAHPVDLAIVDVHMPVMNGVDLIRAMRRDPRLERVPVIVQTADRSALGAPVWNELHVSQVVSKLEFVDWLGRAIDEHTAT